MEEKLSHSEIYQKLMEIGAPQHDAHLMVSVLAQGVSYSWSNTNAVTPELVGKINSFFTQNQIGLKIAVTPYPMRSQFIWDAKLSKKK